MLKSTHALNISEAMTLRAKLGGSEFSVESALSPLDQLLGYLVLHAKMPPESAVDAYFAGGHNDAQAVVALMANLGIEVDDVSALEFAAGFGRVTRHMKKILPLGHLTTSDVHSDACEFIEGALLVKAVQSTPNPLEFVHNDHYDFIFCLSFFSHIPEKLFGPWITALYKCVKPGGHLMLTTHGEHALNAVPEFFSVNYDTSKGFGFRPESDQQDISSEYYGTAVVSNAFMEETLQNFAPNSKVVSQSSGTWFGLQDHWVIQRLP